MITDKTTPTPITNEIAIIITRIDTAAATLTVGPAETACIQETDPYHAPCLVKINVKHVQ